MENLVSIIVPCYNQAHYLDVSLQSVLNQTYPFWECIIINDGSKDNTNEISQKWIEIDSRFKCIEIKNGGVSNARNVGINLAKGIFILPLDADDKISDDYLSLAMHSFGERPTLKLVYCNAELFGLKNGLWKLPKFSLKKLAEYNMIFCSAFFRKEDWLSTGKYDENLKYGLEDYEFWINLLKNGGDVYKIPKVCFYYRRSETSRNDSIKNDQLKDIFEYISIKHADFYVQQLGSFIELNRKYKEINKKYVKLTTYKKEVINLFTETFIGLKLFK